MTLDPGKVFERSVDSLQKIYAVVIALAISQAVQSWLRDPSGVAYISRQALIAGVPALVAFVVTLIPFWHGMNRHLDRCYLERPAEQVVQSALLFDFVMFIVESCFLFAAAWSLRFGIAPFEWLGGLLVVDMAWGFISHLIHSRGRKSHAKVWSIINLVAIFLGILIVSFPFGTKLVVLMMIAIVRFIADYGFCWSFYFPDVATRQLT
jgi:hypothetical protein